MLREAKLHQTTHGAKSVAGKEATTVEQASKDGNVVEGKKMQIKIDFQFKYIINFVAGLPSSCSTIAEQFIKHILRRERGRTTRQRLGTTSCY